MKENSRTARSLLKNICQSTWSNQSIVRNLSRKWNNLAIEFREEKTTNKLKQKLITEISKLP